MQGMWMAGTNPADLDQIASRRFPLAVTNGASPDTIVQFADDCAARHLRAVVPANCATLAAGHPNIFGYLVGDDDPTGKQTATNTAYVHQHDPGKATLTCKIVWGADTVAHQFAHMSMCSHLVADIYPIGVQRFPIRPTVHQLAKLCKRRGQTPAVNLQAFSWSQDAVDNGRPATSQPFPSRTQMRYMRDQAIKGGAKLLLWFDEYFAKPADRMADVEWAAFGTTTVKEPV